jgi:hypothetical protein
MKAMIAAKVRLTVAYIGGLANCVAVPHTVKPYLKP